MVQLSEDAVATYRRDGFLTVDQLISSDEVAHLRTVLLEMHRNGTGYKEGRLFDAIGLDDGSEARFPQIIDPRLMSHDLGKSEYYKVGLSIAKQLLGDNARLRNDITFLKPPKIGSDTPWHQDQAFSNPAWEQKQLSIWLALTQAHVENSCMSFVPGSHQFPVLLHQPVGGDPRVHALECIDGFDQTKVIECPLDAGGCTIHDQRTLHYAGPNHSSQNRLAYVLIFDTPPVERINPLVFPWRSEKPTTVRAEREQAWQKERGMLAYVWRNRHHLKIRSRSDVKRIAKTVVRKLRGH